MLPCFNSVKRRTKTADSVLLTMRWGSLALGITLSRKRPEINFEVALYPQQRLRNVLAIICMALVHILVVYFLLLQQSDPVSREGVEKGKMVFLDLQAQHDSKPEAAPLPPEIPPEVQPENQQKHRSPQAMAPVTSTVRSTSPLAAVDTMSQIEAARKRRQALEEDAVQQNNAARLANNAPSENDIAMARIQANIEAANYQRKGTNGIFQILDKGVQTGRFSFRGWTNDPHQSTRQTYEVDAGVGGDVERAIIRRMIELIREHYQGDFNWDSQRLNRVVVLSARQADTASLETFMMNEFFATK